MQVPGYILAHTNIKDSKVWHFYLLLSGWACIYTVMNVSVVLFLTESLGNIFLAGLALSIGSFFSMMFDGVFSYFQKIFSSRNLFLCSIIGMILAVTLFMIPMTWAAYIAAIFFRISFDLCDITAISYILAKSLPAEYGQNLSYKQLSQGIGMIFGFIVSAVLVKASYFIGTAGESLEKLIVSSQGTFLTTLFFMKLFLLILLGLLWFMSFILFDKEVENMSKEYLISSFQKLEAETIEELKQASTKVVKNIPGKINPEKNQIELKSTNAKISIDKKEILAELLSAASRIISVFRKKPRNISLIWSMTIMGIFSYWDTFLATFLPIFLTQILKHQSGFIQDIPGSLMMLFFILPVLGLLPFVAKLGDKYGRYYFMLTGLILTSFSCVMIGFIYDSSLITMTIAGFGISIGYLFAMSTAKAQTAEKMNEFYAVSNNQQEIDSNVSAGPIMLIDNIGNIIGPLVGSALIAAVGFQGFFIVFSIAMLILLFFSLKNFARISGNEYVFQSPILVKKFKT